MAPPPLQAGTVWPAPRVGSLVVGTVTYTNSKGCKVRLRGGCFTGFVPVQQGPLLLPAEPNCSSKAQAQAGRQLQQPGSANTTAAHPHQKLRMVAEMRKVYGGVLPLGVSRHFLVMAMPTDGRDLLLSAALADEQVVMARALQLQDMLWQDQRPIKARVVSVSHGGCQCEVPGLCGPRALLPWRLAAPHRRGSAQWGVGAGARGRDEAQAAAPQGPPAQQHAKARPPTAPRQHALGVGDELDVLLHTVDTDAGRIILSEHHTALARQEPVLQAGQLVAGHVREVHTWGVVVELQDILVPPPAGPAAQRPAARGHPALLNMQRVTRLPSKPHPQVVFQPGDAVTAKVVYTGHCVDHRGVTQATRRNEDRVDLAAGSGLEGPSLDRWLQVELSLMELERQDGDMLDPQTRQACFVAAAEAATAAGRAVGA